MSFAAPPNPSSWRPAAANLLNTVQRKSRVDLTLLNDQQRQAVTYSGRYPLSIVAAAGSGKTSTISLRVANFIVEQCIRPTNILTVTFTRKAADEMKNRLKIFLGPEAAASVRTNTFHQLCLLIIRSNYCKCGFSASPRVLSKKRQFLIVQECMREYNHMTDLGKKRIPSELDWEVIGGKILQRALSAEKMARSKQNAPTNDDADEEQGSVYIFDGNPFHYTTSLLRQKRDCFQPTEYPHKFIFMVYNAALRIGQMIDLEDFHSMTLQILEKSQDVLNVLQSRWTHILVDEFQDISASQFKLIELLCGGKGHLTVCGDEDQSIYGFRGAVHGFKLLSRNFPKVETVVLNETYRSTPQIIKAAYKLIQCNSNRLEKVIMTRNPDGQPVKVRQCANVQSEIRDIIRQVLHFHIDKHVPLSEIAILSRVRNDLHPFQAELSKVGIPFEYQHENHDRATTDKLSPVTQDMLAYCELISLSDSDIDELDCAFFRVVNTPTRQLGKVAQQKIKEERKQHPSRNVLHAARVVAPHLSRPQQQGLMDFLSMIKSIRSKAASIPTSETVLLIDQRSKYSKSLKTPQQLQIFSSIVIAAGKADRDEISLLEFCQLLRDQPVESSQANSPDQIKNRIILSTIHQAKGKEWDCVFVFRFNEGILPSSLSGAPDQVEEERRVSYVALTRAKSHLLISWIEKTDGGSPAVPSRFLYELPGDLLKPWEPVGDHTSLISGLGGICPKRNAFAPIGVRDIPSSPMFQTARSVLENSNTSSPYTRPAGPTGTATSSDAQGCHSADGSAGFSKLTGQQSHNSFVVLSKMRERDGKSQGIANNRLPMLPTCQERNPKLQRVMGRPSFLPLNLKMRSL